MKKPMLHHRPFGMNNSAIANFPTEDGVVAAIPSHAGWRWRPAIGLSNRKSNFFDVISRICPETALLKQKTFSNIGLPRPAGDVKEFFKSIKTGLELTKKYYQYRRTRT